MSDDAEQRLDEYVAKRPVAGPYLLKRGEYPFTVAVYTASRFELAWAMTVLAPEHGLLRTLEIPPVAQWVGERVDAAVMAPEEWPPEWTHFVG